jgi:hypothetical protein
MSLMKRVVVASCVALLLCLLGCDKSDPVASIATEAVDLAPPWFEEVSQASGLAFRHDSGHEDRFLFAEIIGGGAAVLDVDGDGDLDIYLIQSGNLQQAGTDASVNRLFLNAGDGSFTEAPAAHGADDRGYGMGVAVADYDNDGDVDLYVTNLGSSALYQNDGNGHFTDVTTASNVNNMSWGTSAAFLDYDNDGMLDLFITNYVNWSMDNEIDCYNSSGLLDYCLPINYSAPATDRLFRNAGDGTFVDVTVEMGFEEAFGNGLGVTCSDFNGDGWIDIFVANDTMMNQLWINEEGKRFRNEALLRGCALDEHGIPKAGMGIATEDFDDDGDQDLLVMNIGGQTNSFFRNEDGFFTDKTGSIGMGTVGSGFTRFGVGSVDFDNDGYLDLYQAHGKVYRSAESLTADPFAEPNMLFQGSPEGRFEEVLPRGGTAELQIHTSRAAAFGDFDKDGGIDIVVVNRDGPVYLLRNIVQNRGGWIRFRVLEEHGRDALGAVVQLTLGARRLSRQVRSAYSYCASNDPSVHVGLGDASAVSNVTVLWPGGRLEAFGEFSGGREIVLQKGSGKAAQTQP